MTLSFIVQTGGLPSCYCDVCGKVYKSREELVAHHSAVHYQPEEQPHQTNGVTGVSTSQQDDRSTASGDEEDHETLRKKLGTLADNAPQSNGSLIGIAERDKRKVSI